MRTAIAISCGVLGLTSGYFLGKTGYEIKQFHLLGIPYCLLMIHGVTGLVHELYEDENVEKVNNFTRKVCTCFVLPCFVMYLWHNTSYPPWIGMVHPLMGFIPFITYIADSENTDLEHGLIVFNAISGCAASFLKENLFGAVACVLYALAHGAINIKLDIDLPQEAISNYITCFFEASAFTAMGFSFG